MNFDLHFVDFLLHRLTVYRKWRSMKPHRYREWKAKYDFDNRFGSNDKAVYKFSNGVCINLYRENKLSFEIVNGFETDEIDFLNRFLKKGDTFIDIGTNVGLFSLHAANAVGTEGQVISFEPSSATVNRLKENISLNNFQNIKIIQAGLSSECGELELTVAGEGYDAFNSFAKPFMSTNLTKEKVKVKTLDGFAESYKLKPNNVKLIKIDVEGWETHVLKGSKTFLESDNAPTLLVEFTEANAQSAGSSCVELSQILNDFGYSLYTYSANTGKLNLEPFGKTYSYKNLIASKRGLEF